jgi:hypothetical protein
MPCQLIALLVVVELMIISLLDGVIETKIRYVSMLPVMTATSLVASVLSKVDSLVMEEGDQMGKVVQVLVPVMSLNRSIRDAEEDVDRRCSDLSQTLWRFGLMEGTAVLSFVSKLNPKLLYS